MATFYRELKTFLLCKCCINVTNLTRLRAFSFKNKQLWPDYCKDRGSFKNLERTKLSSSALHSSSSPLLLFSFLNSRLLSFHSLQFTLAVGSETHLQGLGSALISPSGRMESPAPNAFWTPKIIQSSASHDHVYIDIMLKAFHDLCKSVRTLTRLAASYSVRKTGTNEIVLRCRKGSQSVAATFSRVIRLWCLSVPRGPFTGLYIDYRKISASVLIMYCHCSVFNKRFKRFKISELLKLYFDNYTRLIFCCLCVQSEISDYSEPEEQVKIKKRLIYAEICTHAQNGSHKLDFSSAFLTILLLKI